MASIAAPRALLALSASVVALSGAGAALAQTPAPAADEVDTLVVTANRREEAVNEVPMSIQAFRGEQLEELRVTDVKDLSSIVPSFTVSRSYQGVPTYTLRGIGFNTINLSATSTVGTYVDEVAYAYPIMNAGPVFDLERVEVLKGPQGTLFGRNTTAGLINFVTAKPSAELEAGLNAEVANYETTNLEGYISGPWGEMLQARVAFRVENSNEGWQESVSRPGDKLGQVNRYGLRASLAFVPNDAVEIDVSYSLWANKSETLAAQAIGFTPATAASPFNAPGLVAFVGSKPFNDASQADWAPDARRRTDVGTGLGIDKPLEEDSRFQGYKLRAAFELPGDLRLISLTSYADMQRNGVNDWSGAPYEILIQDAKGRIKSFAQELRLEGSTERVTWLVGGYYASDDILDSNRTILQDNANVGTIRFFTNSLLGSPFNTGGYTPLQASQAFRTFVDIGEIDTTTASVFANADWTLTDSFKVTTGVRWTRDTQAYEGCSRDFNGNMLPNVNVTNRALFFPVYGPIAPITQGQCNTFNPNTASFGLVKSELDETNVAWRLALNWAPAEDLLLFASVSKGAKAGATPINAANISTQNAPATQEMLLAYEVGAKAGLFDRRVQANVSGFYYDYEDKQLSVYFADPIYTALARLNNVPESRAYGIDGDLTWRVTPELTAMASAVWLQTEVIGYVGVNAAGLPQDFDGAEFLYSPEWQTSFTLAYDGQVGQVGLKAALNYRWQSESQADLEGNPLFVIPEYGLLTGSVGLWTPDERWGLSLWGRNLTDEYYWSAVSSNANTVVRFPGMPRTFGLTLSMRY
ncbi:MAG TPA: TonB-dependent receptor [Caulobacter sp.]|nr:TonB-dependent receptor [Caulobacter sp.]